MASEYAAVLVMVDKKISSTVLETLRQKHDITKSTIIFARGHSENDGEFFGMKIEPEREVHLTIVEQNEAEKAVETIKEEAGLDESGKGIAIALDLKHAAGLL
jgi:hypothetical protein